MNIIACENKLDCNADLPDQGNLWLKQFLSGDVGYQIAKFRIHYFIDLITYFPEGSKTSRNRSSAGITRYLLSTEIAVQPTPLIA